MGFLDIFSSKRTSDLLAVGSSIDLGIKSPWIDGPDTLSTIVLSDLIGADILDQFPLSRGEAIAIPAVSKARNLLVSAISPLPLRAYDKAGETAEQPTWLYRSDDAVSPYERMAWTVDDLFFYGYSLWRLTRGSLGQILTAAYVPMDSWEIRDGRILIAEPGSTVREPVSAEDVIFFNSPFEGLLNVGRRTLRQARDMENTVAARVRNPAPLVVISATTDDSLEPEEVTSLLDQWNAARRSQEGAVGYLPPGLALAEYGVADPALYLEARNAVVTSIGQFANIRAAMLDGTASIDSLTYTTKDGERNSFYEFDLPFWMDPIQHRLSQDDVVPRGTRVRFDRSEQQNLPTPTGPIVED